MQEPQRYNLSSTLQKSMKVAQKKNFLHRVIYIANYSGIGNHDETAFNISIESNIKLINEECCDDPITGFGLFYTGYFINIIEGPEDPIIKHFATLLETFDRGLSKTPEIVRMKILHMAFHINKRYYSAWSGRHATPPVLLDKIERTTSPEINTRHVQHCILKLYKLSEYVTAQPPNLIIAIMDNISELCRAYLPEVNLLDFLLDSPGLMDLREFLQMSKTVPTFKIYHESIWPLSTDYVPHNILEDEISKQLMSTETKEHEKETEKDKEGDKDGEPDKEKEPAEEDEIHEKPNE